MKNRLRPFASRHRRTLAGTLLSAVLAAGSSAYADTALTTGHTIIDTTGNPALGVISRPAGATVLFDDNGIATATGTPLVNGILGPWAFIGTGTATRYATLDGSDNVAGFTGTATTWTGTINSATTNFEISAASTTATYGGSERVANTIRYTGGTGSVISLGNTSAAGLTVNGLINAGTGTITFQHGGGALAAAGIHIGASQELVLNAANAAITVNARVHDNTGGASAVTVVGPNTVTLSAANTYTGATTINGGKLVIPNNSGATYSQVNLNSGTFDSDANIGSLTVANNVNNIIIPGNASLAATTVTFQGAATLNVQATGLDMDRFIATDDLNTSATGSIVINATNTSGVWTSGTDYPAIDYFGTFTGSLAHFTLGTVPGLNPNQTAELVDTGSSIVIRITGESLVWTGSVNSNWNTTDLNWSYQSNPILFSTNSPVVFDDSASQFDITLTENVSPSTIAFDNDNEDYTLSGGFGIETGLIVKNGFGQVTINTNNTYTGSTIIHDGTLRLGDGTTDGDISSSSAIINDGTLVFNRSGGSFAYGNVISGFGDIVKNGAGTQILSGDNSYSGITTINAGVLQVGNGGTTGSLGTSSITNDASLVFNRSNAFAVSAAINGTGSVSQIGTGAVTFSSANTYSGGTFVNQGTVRIGNNSALGTGAVSIASGATVNNTVVLSGLANAFTGSGTFTTAGAGQVTVSGDWTGFSGLVQSTIGGDMVFNGGFTSAVADTTSANAAYVNNYNSANSNGMIVQNQTGGTVTYKFGSYTSAVGSNLRNSGAATGNVVFEIGNLNTSTEAAGTIGGGVQTTSLTKVGTGTLTLSGANTYTGTTTVNAGVLAVNGNAIANANQLVIDGGKVDPLGATEMVGTLFFGAEQQPAGTYSADPLSGADFIDDVHFTGTGVVSVTTGPSAGYAAWADANGATGQTVDQDHDNDGVENGIEYFMGETGSTFTTNPAPVNGAVTWPMASTYTGVYGTDYAVQISTDLVNWTQVPVGTGDNTVTVTPGTSVAYDMPTGGMGFVRLVVNN